MNSLISGADEQLIQSNIELIRMNEKLTEQLKAARANVCESCVSTTETVDSMDYQIEELTEKVAAKDRMLEGFRKHINRLEYDLNLANSYSTMSNQMLKKEAAEKVDVLAYVESVKK